MTRKEHLLTILMEECSEVAQRASKAIRFTAEEFQPGQDRTNGERITQELNDIVAVAEMLQNEDIVGNFQVLSATSKKKAKVEKFLLYSQERGTLSGEKPEQSVPKPHNPAGLTSEQVGVSNGWRLLDEDEIKPRYVSLVKIEKREDHRWNGEAWRADSFGYTYRTRLSREQLAAISKGEKK